MWPLHYMCVFNWARGSSDPPMNDDTIAMIRLKFAYNCHGQQTVYFLLCVWLEFGAVYRYFRGACSQLIALNYTSLKSNN